MKSKCVRTFLGFLLLMTAFFARADVIVDNENQPTANVAGPIGDDSNSSDFLIGQQFTVPAGTNLYELDEISLFLEPFGGGASITVSIWTNSPANTPSTEIAALPPISVLSEGEYYSVPLTNMMLAPGTYYVVAAPTTPADSGYVYWAFANGGGFTGTGTLGDYADTETGGWTAYPPTSPQQMAVVATPVSPATLKMNRQGGTLKLSWPSGLTGYELDSTTNLTMPTWDSVTNLPVTLGGTNSVTNSLSGPMRFYRLRQDFVVSNLFETVSNWDGPIGMGTNANGFLLGEEWTAQTGPFTVGKVTLSLNPYYGSGRIFASIWNASPQNVPGSPIDMIATQLVTTAGNVTFVPPAPITLPAGSYFLMVGAATPSDSGKVGWNWTGSSAWTGFGILDGYAGTTNRVWMINSDVDGPYLMSLQQAAAP
jgi:hypothetical protein